MIFYVIFMGCAPRLSIMDFQCSLAVRLFIVESQLWLSVRFLKLVSVNTGNSAV